MRVIIREYPRDLPYLTLYPIADVHWGAAECMETEFERYIQRIKDDPTAAVILAGDLINNGIKSSVTNVYREKYPPDVQKDMMIELLEPIKDKIVAGVSGNHEYRTVKESCQDVSKDIFAALQLKSVYAPDAVFLKVSFGRKRNGKPVAYMIYVSHGSGGGALLGSGLSRQDGYQMAIEGVDISISGHTHRPSKTPSSRLVFDPHNNRVTRRNTLIFVCTSWLEYGGYPVRGQLKPTAFYPDTITLYGDRKEWK